MSQTIITKCDICNQPGDRFPSWFNIEQAAVSAGGGMVRMIADTVSWKGYARYEKFVDLCMIHRDKITEAIQKIVTEDKK